MKKFFTLSMFVLTVATGFAQTPVNAPSWWSYPGTTPDGVTRNQYHSFITDPNLDLQPDYTYNGFPAQDLWTIDGQLGAAIPTQNPFVDATGAPAGDNHGLFITNPTTLQKQMGNRFNKDNVKEFFVNVVWFSYNTFPVTLSVTAPTQFVVSQTQTDIVSTVDPNWHSTWLTGTITPQPDVEWFTFSFGPDTWVDSVYVGTHCVPEPSTMAGIGSALIGLIGFGLRRKK